MTAGDGDDALEPITPDDQEPAHSEPPEAPLGLRRRLGRLPLVILALATVVSTVAAVLAWTRVSELERALDRVREDAEFARSASSALQRHQGDLGNQLIGVDQAANQALEDHRRVVVPDLVGIDVRTAAAIAVAAGLTATYARDSGRVVSQDPAPGRVVPRSERVLLVVDGG